MAQYLTAQWDYTAEGNYELSFKEGDKIKLLEKHNDDWWEGELNDEIGFFPANRTIPIIEHIAKKLSTSVSTPSSSVSTTPNFSTRYTTNNSTVATPEQQQRPKVATPISHSNPYLQQVVTPVVVNRKTAPAPILPTVAAKKKSKSSLLVDISTESNIQDDLPSGWAYSYDNSGTIYFFNETTGESQWDKPTDETSQKSTSSNSSSSSSSDIANNNNQDEESSSSSSSSEEKRTSAAAIIDLAYDIKKLNLDALHPNWIRIQSIVQMKIVMDDGLEVSWREYYAVLATGGYLVIYKEGLTKTSRRPNSFKPVGAYGTIDLESCEIIPANKFDTRKRNAFIITNDNVKILVSVPNETLYQEWLDAMMRELISKKENTAVENRDEDLVQLLNSIPLKDKIAGASGGGIVAAEGVSAKAVVDGNNEESNNKSSLTRWFSKSSRSNSGLSKRNNEATTAPAPGKEVFGGYLKLEQDGGIPLVVRSCIEQVDKRGLDVVGIYRLSGQTTSIQKYKNQFNSNAKDVNLYEENDINVITGLLKLYFRELKNPLLTFEYYDRFIEAARLQDYDERMFRLKSIIQVLPVANYKVFQYLVRHLERVKNQSDINKMEASNLAMIFSIGLLRSKQDDLSSSIMHSDLLSEVMETIIQHVDWFFDTDTDDELLIEEEEGNISISINNSGIVALS